MSFRLIHSRHSPFGGNGDEEIATFLERDARVLIVGAGALGCEMLKTMAMMGIGQLHIIDMDTIELSNLNRQSLFREEDVGGAKAEVAVTAIRTRFPKVQVVAHVCRVESMQPTFFQQFHLVLCGVDTVAVRRWLNGMLCSLPETIPLIDGGTEGLLGHVRIVIPGYTACLECTAGLFPSDELSLPLCSLRGEPQGPDHCVQWAFQMAMEQIMESKMEEDFLELVYHLAITRAKEYLIQGVSKDLVADLVQRIIPAVATTTSLVAAWCCQEAYKLLTNMTVQQHNYHFFNCTEGIYHDRQELLPLEDCPVCKMGNINREKI